MSAPRILIADDEIIVARDLEWALKARGYEVIGIAASGEDAIRMTLDAKPDLILMDLVLKGELDGMDTAERIRKQSKVPIIFLTAYRGASNLLLANVTEACAYVVKPFEMEELQPLIEKALDEHRTDVASETPDPAPETAPKQRKSPS